MFHLVELKVLIKFHQNNQKVMDQGGSSYPEGKSTIHEPGRRELPTQSYVRPLSWLDSNLSRQEPEEDLVPASSDEGL